MVQLVSLIILAGCSDSPPEGSANGSNYGWVEISSYPGLGYDPNVENYFEVTVKTYVPPSYYPGYNWLYFQILSGGESSLAWSGVLQIPASSSIQQHTLEWGGGWLRGTGKYKLRAGVYNVVGTDKNSALSEPVVSSFDIDKFNEAGLSSKSVEYDQCGNNRVYSTANLRQNGEGRRIVREAFVQAGIDISFRGLDDQIEDDCDRIDVTPKESGGPGANEVGEWILQHRDAGADIYLAGIVGFSTTDGSEVPWGVTSEQNGIPIGSLIAFEDVVEHADNDPYDLGDLYTRMKLLQSVVVHEFGHQLGISGHDNHSSIWCIMLGLKNAMSGDPTDNPPPRLLFMNPHFCENHINQLKAGL